MSRQHTLEELFSLAEALRGANLQARTVPSLKEQLAGFLSDYTPAGYTRSSAQVWWRARKCENDVPFSSLTKLIYREDGTADFGRAQLPRQRVLYASWNFSTALAEIGAQPGDMVQIITLRPIPIVEVPCIIVGEYQSFAETGRSVLYGAYKLERHMTRLQASGREQFGNLVFVDAVIADLFRARVKRSFEYKLTALYADRVHATGTLGLIYPSVETAHGLNLALPAPLFDAQFEVLFTEVFRIKKLYGYGLGEYEFVAASCDFAADGTIDWTSKRAIRVGWRPEEGMRASESFRGWRKPPTAKTPPI